MSAPIRQTSRGRSPPIEPMQPIERVARCVHTTGLWSQLRKRSLIQKWATSGRSVRICVAPATGPHAGSVNGTSFTLFDSSTDLRQASFAVGGEDEVGAYPLPLEVLQLRSRC